MNRIPNRNVGSTNSVVLIVILGVVTFLFALGAWMWIDMKNSHLEEKAEAYARNRNQYELTPAPAVVAPISKPPQPVSVSPLLPSTVSPSQAESGVIECRRVSTPIVIDGLPSDAAWSEAQVIENFAQPWLGPNQPARSQTKARLLWDDDFLYFVAEMDDSDIFADVKQHNGDLWNNDVFELFFKPSKTGLGYYEFEINPLNTTLEVYFPSRGSGGLRRWAKAYPFHMESKVTMRGISTLNEPADRDAGWIVEGRIPWADFGPTGGRPRAGDEWKFALCRFDFSVHIEEPEMSTSAPLSQKEFHRYEDYTVLKFK